MKPTSSAQKGQVEVQFNWIFVLIVGAIILTFFVTIAARQKGASEQQIRIDFMINFEKALGGISAVEGKKLLFEVPNMNLRYDCTSSCDCAAYVGESRAKTQAFFSMGDKIIFSPNRLKGNFLMTASEDWSYPFKVTNFIYITSPEVKYLIEDTPKGKIIMKNLPDNSMLYEQKEHKAFDKQLFNFSDEIKKITGNYKVKFVFLENNPITENFIIPSDLQGLADTDVTAVKFDLLKPEKVIFYQKNGNEFKEIGKSYLFGTATELGAIFAEDMNSYSCMMNKALKSYSMVSLVYAGKMELYSTENLGIDSRCKINYVSSSIDSLNQLTDKFNFKLSMDTEAETISKNADTILKQNENAMEDSCPHIY